MYFDEAVDKFEDNSIDILHIDGLHTYEAVKHDFETWFPKVKKKTGIILLHDVCEKSDDFGVYKLWEELKKKYKTITFEHYHGLGVLFLSKGPFPKNLPYPEILITYYKKVSETQDLNKALNDKNIHIDNLEKKVLEHLKKAKELTNQNKELTNQKKELTNQKKELTNQNKRLMEENKKLRSIISTRDTQLEKIYTSKSWRLTQPLRKLAEVIRNIKTKN
jgi:hypothetical protein